MQRLFFKVGLIFFLCCGSNSFESKMDLLAPQSLISAQKNEQTQFARALTDLEFLKNEALKKGTPSKERLREKIVALAEMVPGNRDEYLLGRKMLGWWLFASKFFHLYDLRFYADILAESNDQFEKNYFAQFPEEFLNFAVKVKPIWPEDKWFEIPETSDTAALRKIYNSMPIKEKINSWLMEKGVLVKALHLVHGLSAQEILAAIHSREGLKLNVLPEGEGAVKYVLRVNVLLNGKNFSFAFKGYRPNEGGFLNMGQEINTVNLLTGPRFPVLGTVNHKEGFWLEEHIFGRHPVAFILEYASLEDKQTQKSLFSEAEIISIWRDIQLKAATQYLLLFLKEFSARVFIDDPHLENIKFTWDQLQKKQIDLDDLKIFDVGDIQQMNMLAKVIDAGSIAPIRSEEAWKHFESIYMFQFQIAEDLFRLNLPSVSLTPLPTKIEFLKSFFQNKELTDSEKELFLSLIMPYLQKYEAYKKGLTSSEKMLNSDQKIGFYRELQEYLYEMAEKNILVLLDDAKSLSPQDLKRIREGWGYILSLAKPENSERLFSDVNGMLEVLAQSAASFQIRQLANEIHFERTGKYVVDPLVEDFLPPIEMETAI